MGKTGNIHASRTWNGTFGFAYVDGVEMLTLNGIEIKDSVEYEEIAQPGELRDGQKMVKLGGSGEFSVKVADKKLVRKLADMIDEGLQPEVTIEATQDDPASPEALYMSFHQCTIENLDYIIANPHEVSGESFPFKFKERKFLN